MCLFIFLEYLYYLQLIKVGLKSPSRKGHCLLTLLFIWASTGHTLHPFIMMKLECHGWETSCGLSTGFCSKSRKSGYISSSLAPSRTNSIAIQVLNKHALGVLSTYGG